MVWKTNDNFQADLDLIASISSIPAILKLIRSQADMRFVAVARVTEQRWITCAVLDDMGVGLVPGAELNIKETICKEHLAGAQTIAFDDVNCSSTYVHHPVPRQYGFNSYISVPIVRADGSHFGSLCALDPEARPITQPALVGMVEGLAGLIGLQLDEALAHGAVKKALTHEQTVGSSREEFIAVVAHDLRNPLTTIKNASELLLRSKDAQSSRIGDRLKSSARRMTGLINDLVDFARGRAGSSMPAQLSPSPELPTALHEVMAEIQESHPQRDLRAEISFPSPVVCDPSRLQQLVSNLLGNAIVYGAPDKPIVVNAYEQNGTATIVVTNWGPKIDEAKLIHVFDAYWRADDRGKPNFSMGLGLHICRLIAEAHNGLLKVSSDESSGTRFEMKWPSGC